MAIDSGCQRRLAAGVRGGTAMVVKEETVGEIWRREKSLLRSLHTSPHFLNFF